MSSLRFLVAGGGVMGKAYVSANLKFGSRYDWFGGITLDGGGYNTMIPEGKATMISPEDLSKAELIVMICNMVPEYHA